jgi:hypothetical protein
MLRFSQQTPYAVVAWDSPPLLIVGTEYIPPMSAESANIG